MKYQVLERAVFTAKNGEVVSVSLVKTTSRKRHIDYDTRQITDYDGFVTVECSNENFEPKNLNQSILKGHINALSTFNIQLNTDQQDYLANDFKGDKALLFACKDDIKSVDDVLDIFHINKDWWNKVQGTERVGTEGMLNCFFDDKRATDKGRAQFLMYLKGLDRDKHLTSAYRQMPECEEQYLRQLIQRANETAVDKVEDYDEVKLRLIAAVSKYRLNDVKKNVEKSSNIRFDLHDDIFIVGTHEEIKKQCMAQQAYLRAYWSRQVKNMKTLKGMYEWANEYFDDMKNLLTFLKIEPKHKVRYIGKYIIIQKQKQYITIDL